MCKDSNNSVARQPNLSTLVAIHTCRWRPDAWYDLWNGRVHGPGDDRWRTPGTAGDRPVPPVAENRWETIRHPRTLNPSKFQMILEHSLYYDTKLLDISWNSANFSWKSSQKSCIFHSASEISFLKIFHSPKVDAYFLLKNWDWSGAKDC